MSLPRILFVLSADFGEYVTASLFSRGQPFESHFAIPGPLAAYVAAGRAAFTAYTGLEEIEQLATRLRPDVVILASGYMFPVNRIARPEALDGFVAGLRQTGCAVATTDPWLRISAFKPGSRLSIHSVSKRGVDPEASAKMQALQQYLERVFGAMPHLFAVPLKGGGRRCMPFFNADFVHSAPALEKPANDGEHRWLFVLSREDFVFLAGFESETFFDALRRRVNAVLSVGHNRLTFIGPAELGQYLARQWPGEPRIRFLRFCDFDAFEVEMRRARVVAYWNTLSSSLLYCLYYRIPPIFFGTGHQARVCPGLFEHVVKHVYCGRAPALLDAGAPMEADADELLGRLGLDAWLDDIAGDYGVLPPPAAVVGRIRQFHGGE